MKKTIKTNKDYVGTRIVLPSLNLDFMLIAHKKDAKQFDKFFEYINIMWIKLGNKSTPIKES